MSEKKDPFWAYKAIPIDELSIIRKKINESPELEEDRLIRILSTMDTTINHGIEGYFSDFRSLGEELSKDCPNLIKKKDLKYFRKACIVAEAAIVLLHNEFNKIKENFVKE